MRASCHSSCLRVRTCSAQKVTFAPFCFNGTRRIRKSNFATRCLRKSVGQLCFMQQYEGEHARHFDAADGIDPVTMLGRLAKCSAICGRSIASPGPGKSSWALMLPVATPSHLRAAPAASLATTSTCCSSAAKRKMAHRSWEICGLSPCRTPPGEMMYSAMLRLGAMRAWHAYPLAAARSHFSKAM